MENAPRIRSTTVIGLTLRGTTVIGSDGQVTVGGTVMKHTARKARRLYNGAVLAGFFGRWLGRAVSHTACIAGVAVSFVFSALTCAA